MSVTYRGSLEFILVDVPVQGADQEVADAPIPERTPARTQQRRGNYPQCDRPSGRRTGRPCWASESAARGGQGSSFVEAARQAGRRSGPGVGRLVARFNGTGLAALDGHHGGGPPIQYGPAERERILREFHRSPDREGDGTATWSLTTLQRALQRAPDGLPKVSTWTILQTLWEAGYTWQQSRTWCPTGTARRKRKGGTVTVTDPDATPQKN